MGLSATVPHHNFISVIHKCSQSKYYTHTFISSRYVGWNLIEHWFCTQALQGINFDLFQIYSSTDQLAWLHYFLRSIQCYVFGTPMIFLELCSLGHIPLACQVSSFILMVIVSLQMIVIVNKLTLHCYTLFTGNCFFPV